ncbi:MAG: ribosome biogenesis GTP-binding protein YihA/YsxC [Nitrosomonas sp.]|nr:MAG: ribosome biogenesis GTP-binding protein YihA/YsxC [Nitrosomonas sp.]
MNSFQNASFIASINEIRDLPKHDGIEIAFAGRSNAGKSSAINTLTRRNRLAFVSKTPGRTQQINFFRLNPVLYLVDLPGYGYAKVPEAIRMHWRHLLNEYLQKRPTLAGLVLIMDIRHPLTSLDIQMIDWFLPTGKDIHVVLTKSDKLSKLQANNTLSDVTHFLNKTYSRASVQLFSSAAAIGVEDMLSVLNRWIDKSMYGEKSQVRGS